MMSVDSTYLLCCCYSIITKALEVLNERYCINSLSSHEEAVTSKYFSTEFVSQINFFISPSSYVVYGSRILLGLLT